MTWRNVEVILMGLAIVWSFAWMQRSSMTSVKWAMVVVGSLLVVAVMVLYPLYW